MAAWLGGGAGARRNESTCRVGEFRVKGLVRELIVGMTRTRGATRILAESPEFTSSCNLLSPPLTSHKETVDITLRFNKSIQEYNLEKMN